MTPLITVEEWLSVRDWMVPSIKATNGTHTEEDVFFMCAAGNLKLWRFEKSAAITEFVVYPQFKVLNAFLVGGELDDLWRNEKTLLKYGRENGCRRLTGGGRTGWSRTHPDGWLFNCTTLYKEID